jgi:hypothetical protein
MTMNDLMLHRGSVEVTEEQLMAVFTPQPTESWTPLAHADLLDAVRREVLASGLMIARQSLALSQAGNGNWGDRFFGLLQIQSESSDYQFAIGVRNSHDLC